MSVQISNAFHQKYLVLVHMDWVKFDIGLYNSSFQGVFNGIDPRIYLVKNDKLIWLDLF